LWGKKGYLKGGPNGLSALKPEPNSPWSPVNGFFQCALFPCGVPQRPQIPKRQSHKEGTQLKGTHQFSLWEPRSQIKRPPGVERFFFAWVFGPPAPNKMCGSLWPKNLNWVKGPNPRGPNPLGVQKLRETTKGL